MRGDREDAERWEEVPGKEGVGAARAEVVMEEAKAVAVEAPEEKVEDWVVEKAVADWVVAKAVAKAEAVVVVRGVVVREAVVPVGERVEGRVEEETVVVKKEEKTVSEGAKMGVDGVGRQMRSHSR